MSSGLGGNLFQSFLDWIYSSGGISVPADYHSRCDAINCMLDNDITGVINTVVDYSIESASDANYSVECSEPTLEKLLNKWFERINIDIAGVPTGLQALSKEYFKERWQGSSFCILRMKDWEKITVDGITIEVPTTMWFVNGASIYVQRPTGANYKLGSDKYFLDPTFKTEIPIGRGEGIVIQKPYNRWFDQYSTPYLVRKGVLKNFLAIKTLQEKSDEVVSKILPYLFMITKGTQGMFDNDVTYSDTELKILVEGVKTELEKYKSEKNKTPINAVPFDQKYEHMIPDLTKMVNEDLYRAGYRAILSGLGFVDMLEIAPSRQESRLNPKAFLAEVNDGVNGFKGILLDVIAKIIAKNITAHRKLFNESGKIIIVNNPLRINIDTMLEALRSGFDRGVVSIKTYQGVLGVDYDTEKQRREAELKAGDEELFYPHLVVNQESTPDNLEKIVPSKPKNEKNENQGKKPGTPESKNYKSAELEMAPYTLKNLPEFIKSMTIKCQETFVATFNDVYLKTNEEGKAFAIAYNAAKRCMTKQGYVYDKETKKWNKNEV
jgi:hypothetical protein